MSRGVLSATLLILVAALPANVACGQAAWEYSPYRVRVRIALEPVPQLPTAIVPTLGESITARSQAVLGAVWQVETAAAPPALRDELLLGAEPSADRLALLGPEDLNADKLMLTAIVRKGGGFHVTVREVDCRTRQLNAPVTRIVFGMPSLATAVWDALLESFTPLARIEMVEESRITARLRAGGLITDPVSRALVEPGMVLRPILRRNDRTGQPLKGGIQAIPWTLLAVEERKDALLTTTLTSGYRATIPTRSSSRSERLALLVRPRWPSTRLVLRSRTDASKPLAGYEIHVKPPGATAEQTELLGVTDVDGAVELSRGDGKLQLLYVKSGKQLLARLPVLPGQSERLEASLADDDPRLQAEGLILAMQSRALDLVARREILASRFRARLRAGQLAEAQQLLDDFRKMETRAELSRDLNEYRQSVSSPDRLTQLRIDKLFADAQKVLALRQLSDEMLGQLTRELSAARSGSVSKASGN
jgi:hypothetical protein